MDRPAVREDNGAAQRLGPAEADGNVTAEGPPYPPEDGPQGAGRLQKRGLRTALNEAAAAHPTKRIQLWFQDEARVGQKGRLAHRWWTRGQRPPGVCDRRFEWTYIFGAVNPADDEGFALVMPAKVKVVVAWFRLLNSVYRCFVLRAGWRCHARDSR